jgi:membrane protein
MPNQRRAPIRARARDFVELWIDCLARHDMLTYASAIAFQTLIALVPLVLLGLGLLGALHRTNVWTSDIAPTIARKLTPTSYSAVEAAANLIFSATGAGLLVFAGLLAIWEVSGAVRACMGGMNKIYEIDEGRPAWIRFGISLGLAAAITVCLVGSVILLTFLKGTGTGAVHWVVFAARWLGALVVLGIAVALLVRFGPAKARPVRWDSFGAALIVVSWLVSSLIFKVFVTSIANFKTATGQLTVFLVLTGYFYVASIIFLVGVQLDELLRADARPGARGILDLTLGR